MPKEYTRYSVFIPEDDIEDRLGRIPPEKVEQAREEVIGLIPRKVYVDPRAKLKSIKDAFNVAVEAVIEKVTRLRRNMVVGLNESDDFLEGNKQWDGFLSEPRD
ncbi:uncharacterized protein J3R85_008922 [Psidium guajava]|nr:uncharacterized protein J3R85_008922 [Psidium guajava]